MKRKISKKTLEKATKALNEINIMLKDGTYSDMNRKEVLRQNNVSSNLFHHASDYGLFKKVNRGVYTSNFNQIQPIQVRRAIEFRADVVARKKQNGDVVERKKPVKKKQISLFWGLIKFTL